VYVNGVSQAALTNSIPLPRGYIGAGYSSSSAKIVDYMLGGVDEILLFNRALSTSEISNIYAAGSAGLVRAPEFTGTTNLGGGQVRLSLRGQTAKNFTLYSSINLSNWTSLGPLANPTGATQYIDAGAAGAPQKFYRASQP
jgi:hypothetical protein